MFRIAIIKDKISLFIVLSYKLNSVSKIFPSLSFSTFRLKAVEKPKDNDIIPIIQKKTFALCFDKFITILISPSFLQKFYLFIFLNTIIKCIKYGKSKNIIPVTREVNLNQN